MRTTVGILMSLMLIGMAVPLVPLAAADTVCPGGALACCTVGAGAGVTCNVVGGCSLGTTKQVHVHAGVGAASITMNCAFGAGVGLDVISCTGTNECTNTASDGIGGNMRCTLAGQPGMAGAAGYCAIFP